MRRAQLEALCRQGWRALAPDLRGYGATAKGEDKTTLETHARDAAALLDTLGVDEAVVVGLSMGGQIAMEFARLFGHRVAGLVLAATFPQAETEEGRRARYAAADRVLREGMGPYADELLPKMLAPGTMAARPEVTERVLAMMRAAPSRGAAASLRGRAERPDYAPVLAVLDCPVLIVAGDEDAFTTRADAERMQGLVRGSRLVWMEKTGHIPNLEREAEFNAALVEFLETVATTW